MGLLFLKKIGIINLIYLSAFCVNIEFLAECIQKACEK